MGVKIDMSDGRYPYTYACDYIRGLAGYNESGTILSRGDASKIRSGIAEAIGMDDVELANKLADYYKRNEKRLSDLAVVEITRITIAKMIED